MTEYVPFFTEFPVIQSDRLVHNFITTSPNITQTSPQSHLIQAFDSVHMCVVVFDVKKPSLTKANNLD